jgi:predicted CoA-binding protein
VNGPSIAVIGASQNRAKFGNKCVRAFLHRGYRVYPINPHGGEIEGLPAATALADLPIAPDRISIYLPPHKTRALLPDLARYPEAQIWFNPGSANPAILEEARAAGIDVRDGCSIVDIGLSPSQFP